MGLADEIYEAIQVEEGSNKDELGIEKPDSLNADYLIERAVALSKLRRPSEHSTSQLHMRSRSIYLGNNAIVESRDNTYILTEYNGYIPPNIDKLFWVKLKTALPKISRNFIQISKNLFWDKDNGEIIDKNTLEERLETEPLEEPEEYYAGIETSN